MFIFNVQQKNRINQKGLLKRFSIDCYGKQQSLEDIRSVKAEKFKELNSKRGTDEYNEWFLNYRPEDNIKKNSNSNKNTTKSYKIKKTIKNNSKPKKKNYTFNFWGKNKK